MKMSDGLEETDINTPLIGYRVKPTAGLDAMKREISLTTGNQNQAVRPVD
jgi:hypothetical protein